MILVTGATGTIGSEVVRLLESRGEAFRATSRSQPVRAFHEDPESLRRALEGVRSLLLVTAFGGHLTAHDVAWVEAARTAGVQRVVKVSAIGTGDSDDPADVRSFHLAGERAVMDSGMAWTILRPSTFASNALGWAELIKAGLPLQNTTGAGLQGIVDARDVSAAAVEALTSSAHEGHAYTLTGPDLLSVPDQAALIGKAIGREVAVTEVPLDTARAQMVASGADPGFVEVAMTGAAFVRDGGNAILTESVERLLGRAPLPFAAWAAANAEAFKGPESGVVTARTP